MTQPNWSTLELEKSTITPGPARTAVLRSEAADTELEISTFYPLVQPAQLYYALKQLIQMGEKYAHIDSCHDATTRLR